MRPPLFPASTGPPLSTSNKGKSYHGPELQPRSLHPYAAAHDEGILPCRPSSASSSLNLDEPFISSSSESSSSILDDSHQLRKENSVDTTTMLSTPVEGSNGFTHSHHVRNHELDHSSYGPVPYLAPAASSRSIMSGLAGVKTFQDAEFSQPHASSSQTQGYADPNQRFSFERSRSRSNSSQPSRSGGRQFLSPIPGPSPRESIVKHRKRTCERCKNLRLKCHLTDAEPCSSLFEGETPVC
ncbi:hypothetical protein DL96DRAFT_1595100 [Flagelloscypha sp. PMI_526]|nr:hypothetical protein DL96DRAFT_1595100 [Flagelloscypha sp. PMI_526]